MMEDYTRYVSCCRVQIQPWNLKGQTPDLNPVNAKRCPPVDERAMSLVSQIFSQVYAVDFIHHILNQPVSKPRASCRLKILIRLFSRSH